MGAPKLRDVKVNIARMLTAGKGRQVLGGYNVRPLVKDEKSAEQYGPGYVALGDWVATMLEAAPRGDDGSVTDAALQHLWATVKEAGNADQEGVGIFLPSSTGLRHQREVGLAGARAIVPDEVADVLEGLV